MSAALRHLRRADPVMAQLIRRAGPWAPVRERGGAYAALLEAVAHQQLTGKAAKTILGRFHALYGDGGGPAPEQLLATPDETLRGVGFSRAKVAALKDIAAKTLDGTIPERRALARMRDEAIITRLSAARGVGRWTVEMFLIFTLGRPDVLPVDDYGVRNGFRIAYGRRALPAPRALARFGARWAPYRTTAAWYLWRAVDLERGG
ncbi:MAG: DNA-3-methyladenine glycosylase 2 family protein [Gammaproteobacteria bacterium]|nr:DNA-3-methyladenine glycosylase 2 family protein [Gammaproteobacteria bacterium]